MGDEFLNNCMIVYIEIEIARKFSTKFIRNDFVVIKECRAQFC